MKRVGVMLAALSAVTATVAGCDSSEGTPVAVSTSASADALWDPCTQIPDETLRAAGADPATKEVGVGGRPQAGWKICSWRTDSYRIGVFSTSRGISEFEQKPGNVDFTDVTIADRQGLQFRVTGASYELMCDVAFPAAQGAIQLAVSNRASLDGLPDPCVSLKDAGEILVPTFPK